MQAAWRSQSSVLWEVCIDHVVVIPLHRLPTGSGVLSQLYQELGAVEVSAKGRENLMLHHMVYHGYF